MINYSHHSIVNQHNVSNVISALIVSNNRNYETIYKRYNKRDNSTKGPTRYFPTHSSSVKIKFCRSGTYPIQGAFDDRIVEL